MFGKSVESNRSKWRVPLTIAFLLSLSLNCLLTVAYCFQQIQIEFAAEQITTFVTVANNRAPSQAADYISGYYLPGTKLRKGSRLSEVVECVRVYLLDTIVDRV